MEMEMEMQMQMQMQVQIAGTRSLTALPSLTVPLTTLSCLPQGHA